MVRLKAFVCCAAFGLLAGCGGDGGAASDPAAIPSTPPVTTPTTPVPPTPSPAYDMASDFSRDRGFTAIGTTTTLVYAPDGNGTLYTYAAALDGEGPAIGFDYVAATRTYRVRYLGDAADFVTGAVAASSLYPGYDEYRLPDDGTAVSAYFGRTPLRLGLSYTGFAMWRLAQPKRDQAGAVLRVHRLLFGATTVPSDLPTGGVTTYSARVDMSEHDTDTATIGGIGAIRAASADLSIDWSRKALTGVIRVNPPSGTGTSTRPPDTYAVSGTVSDDGHLTGSIVGLDMLGSLQGNVYGPRAAEIGFLFTYGGTRGRRVDYAGAVLGGAPVNGNVSF